MRVPGQEANSNFSKKSSAPFSCGRGSWSRDPIAAPSVGGHVRHGDLFTTRDDLDLLTPLQPVFGQFILASTSHYLCVVSFSQDI